MIARALADAESGSSSPGTKRKGRYSVGKAKVHRAGSTAAEIAAIIPFARNLDRQKPVLHLNLPEDCLLVSASTYRTLTWGKNGHRTVLNSFAPELSSHVASVHSAGESRISLTVQEVAERRNEWTQLPIAVPQIPPRAGHCYVASETGDKLSVGSEMYHRILVEEQVPPKQVTTEAYEASLVARKEAQVAGKDERKRFGETAPLGVKVRLTPQSSERVGEAVGCSRSRLGRMTARLLS